MYSRYGQPRALRSAAVGAFRHLAKDDSSLQDILITLIDDPDRSVRFQAWGAVRELKLKKAAPALAARLGQEATGFNGMGRRLLEDTIASLKDDEPKTVAAGAVTGAKTIDDLEKQATDLEKKAKELREKIETLKVKATSKQRAQASTTAAGS